MEMSAPILGIIINLFTMIVGFVVIVFVNKAQLQQLVVQVVKLDTKVTAMSEEFAGLREARGHTNERLAKLEASGIRHDSEITRLREKVARYEGEYDLRPGTQP